ncbi:MAG: carboxylesterase family protein, partial [Bacteroidaceae bacterium]|nr:carboxylesterase family protein [Bacteroidaceae bacterium]
MLHYLRMKANIICRIIRLSVVFTLAIVAAGCQKACPILDIEGGQVQGVSTGINGVYVFRGIPYAAPPIHGLRWKAPQPVIPWNGVRICDRFGRPGFQHTQFNGGYYTEWGYGDESTYSEDCLYLNVWTSKPGQSDAGMPVILWIHGGGCREGFGSEPEFDGQEIAAKDVVLVTINYRLGVFGFLAHPELTAESGHNASGDYGLLDQIQSLRWVQDNIAAFGGDPDNVTLAGQSAGGGCVRMLCESPLARGLFHKAVIMSAGGLATAPESETDLSEFHQAEQKSKTIMDWAGYTSLDKM